VISVAAADTRDQATGLGPRNSSCIDIWAPSGDVGTGIWGADPASRSSYVRIINRSFAAAAVAAGVAASYLQLNPGASPAEVRRALLAGGSQQTVTGAGKASPATLIYAGFLEGMAAVPLPPSAAGPDVLVPTAGAAASSGGGLPVGALAAVVTVAALGESARRASCKCDCGVAN
jgi:hypothetical protein